MIDELELVRRVRPEAKPAAPAARRAARASLAEAIAREQATPYRRGRRRAWRLSHLAMMLGPAAAVAVAALFLSLSASTPSTSSRRPAIRPPVPASKAPQLVSMRRINGATWQTVVVRTDGTGDVGIFIGERAGTTHRQFRLAPRQLARLKRLVILAAQTRRTPPLGSLNPSVEYIIYTQRNILELVGGRVPGQLAELVAILNALIESYA